MTTQSYHPHIQQDPHGKKLFTYILGALGVVYGDIGTSPLYALKESFNPEHGLPLNEANIFGILSLVFWSLMLMVSVKYLGFILKADKQGEGGITTLLSLLIPKLDSESNQKVRTVVVILGLFGAGLLFGEGIITPAISVLSAVEGLQVATPYFQPFIVPITVVILFLLFRVQKNGTHRMGNIFGPTALIWFLTLIVTGLPWILKHPEILYSINPFYAFDFFRNHGLAGLMALSSVVLCITGAEALYADMGHFGRKPIQMGWFYLVFPALLINYFGQGALVLDQGTAVLGNTFYGLVSGWLIYPLIVIATFSTVIASQALISGAFSLTQQTVQLGYFPRTVIQHTSRETEGQIFVPKVNLFLMIACIMLVVGFEESTKLASAYGIAVTATMTITSILFFFVTQKIWKWKLWASLSLAGLFLFFDLAFLTSNLTKLFHGGFIPVIVAFSILSIMTTWKKGRASLGKSLASVSVPLVDFIQRLNGVTRVKGTAVFMTLSKDIAPSVLLHHYKHNQVIHEQVILLSIITEHDPEIQDEERCSMTKFDRGFFKVVARYGYMETPNVVDILTRVKGKGIDFEFATISYYLGRESFVMNGDSGMAKWRKKLFVFLSRNARPATEFFNLPPDRVIEIGSQVKI